MLNTSSKSVRGDRTCGLMSVTFRVSPVRSHTNKPSHPSLHDSCYDIGWRIMLQFVWGPICGESTTKTMLFTVIERLRATQRSNREVTRMYHPRSNRMLIDDCGAMIRLSPASCMKATRLTTALQGYYTKNIFRP